MKVTRILFYLLMPVFLVAGLYTGMRLWFILLIAQVLLLLFLFARKQIVRGVARGGIKG